MLLEFLFHNLSHLLVRGFEELIANEYFVAVGELSFVLNGRVEVEKDRKEDLLFGIEHLVFKAKALYLVEIKRSVLRHDLVDGYSYDRLISFVVGLVEG